jgi:hypothetical protein
MVMNPELAMHYNTNGYHEKVAEIEGAVQVFIKMAEEEGVDLSPYSEDQIVEMALETQEELAGGAFSEKFAEADYLGRVIAHSMWDEQQKIAGEKYDPRATADEVRKIQRSGGTEVVRYKAKPKARAGASTLSRIGKHLAKHKGKYLGGLGAAAALGGGAAYLSSRGKEKKSHLEILEEAAINHAESLLKQASVGRSITQEMDFSTDQNDFDRLVTERAWDLLDEAGHLG